MLPALGGHKAGAERGALLVCPSQACGIHSDMDTTVVIVGVAIAILLVIGFFVLFARDRRAESRRAEAQEHRGRAELNRLEAEKLEAEAEERAARARREALAAEQQRIDAANSRAKAEELAERADSVDPDVRR